VINGDFEIQTPTDDNTTKLIGVLEKGLTMAPRHAGLCHLYVHALEMGPRSLLRGAGKTPVLSQLSYATHDQITKARDSLGTAARHRKTCEKKGCVFLQGRSSVRRAIAFGAARKRHFLRHLYIKIIILPRQARDKHRENSKKVPFSQASPTRARPAICSGRIGR
jgi:hypothetical protein